MVTAVDLFCFSTCFRFAAEFDFRTFDPEGVVLYAESSQDSWFMLGLRDGRIEVQFNNQHTFKLTSGGKAINDGQWRVVRTGDALPAAGLGWEVKGNASDDSQISVDELESSISVKISKEAVMSINSPESLFVPVNGVVETKVYIAGLPERAGIIKQVSSLMFPMLDRARSFQNKGGPLRSPRRSLDQPSSGRLHPGMEPDEPGGVEGQGGHPGAKEQTVLRVRGKRLLFQWEGIGQLRH